MRAEQAPSRKAQWMLPLLRAPTPDAGSRARSQIVSGLLAKAQLLSAKTSHHTV
jgi:hypothetical protein